MDRIGSLSLYNQTVLDFQKSQKELGRLQRQISGGVNSETYDELGSDLTRYINTSANIDQTANFIRHNDLIGSRLKAYDLTLKQLQDVATELRSVIVQERSNSADAVPLADIAKKLLGQVQDRLSVTVEGRYIFAGSKTDTRPVNDIVNTSNIINGASSDNYYQGDSVTLSIKTTEDLEINYGIKANDKPFQDLIAALHKAIEGDNDNDAALVKSLDFLNEAIDGLATSRNSVGNNMKSIENATKQHRLTQTFLQELVGNIINTDIPEATIKVSLNETILQASFQVFSRIGSLKLIDFIR